MSVHGGHGSGRSHPTRGRGAVANPAGRFERLSVERVEDDEAGLPPDRVETEILRDTSRSIIARNSSPDIPFDASLNPYRGCEHGCVYCLDGETPVLMGDGTTRSLAALRPGDEIYGTRRDGWYRRLVRTRVLAHWETTKPAYAVSLADGTRLIAGGDHRFLTERGWSFVSGADYGGNRRPHLTPGTQLIGTGRIEAGIVEEDATHRRGAGGSSIARKRDVAGAAIKSRVDLRVRSIEPLGSAVRLFDITTGTGDFIADRVVSHNCYARPTHEYAGFSAGLDFESRILVKREAPELLRRELGKRSWRPQTLAMSGVTDPYQPVERKLRITRGCLEVLAEHRNPVMVITKSALVLRDADLLAELARWGAVRVALSVTTLDLELARRMEPRAAAPKERLRAIAELTAAGIPTGVMVAPVIPGLTDHEIPAILAAAAEAGAETAGYVPLRLPGAVAGLFEAWLAERFPERKEKILGRVRALRGGRLNDPRFGSRMRGEGVFAEQIHALFTTARRRVGLERRGAPLSAAAFRRPGDQLALF